MPRSIEATLERNQSQGESFWDNTRPVVLDDINNPNVGGIESDLNLTGSIVIARPTDRNSPYQESHKPTFKPVELAPNLRINPELEKARFYTWMEMRRFIYDINAHRSAGKSFFEAISLSTEVFEDHIKSYDAEIIRQNPVLLHLNKFGIWNGEKRMLGNNGRPVVDAIDEVERRGSVKRAAQKIEEFLLNAENNSFIVLMSPQGESGFSDENGQDTPHLNTQTMVFWKDKNGNLKGITLVTDLTVDQAEKVMEDLGTSANFLSKKGSEMDRVANIVENPAEFSLVEEYKNPFQYVFDKILARRGLGDIRLKQKKGVELRSVNKMRQSIEKFETLLNFNLVEFRTFILDNFELVGDSSFQQTIVNKAEETVFLLGEEFLDQNNTNVIQFSPKLTYTQSNYDRSSPLVRSENNYARVVAFLQSRGGCPTGSSAIGVLAGVSLGLAGGSIVGGGILESDSMGSLSFPCPKCRAINKRPREGFVEKCQSCGTDEVACKSSSTITEKKQNEDYQLAKAA